MNTFVSRKFFTPDSMIKIFNLAQIRSIASMGILGLRHQNANEKFYAKTNI